MGQYAIRIHPIKEVPEVFYYLNTIFETEDEDFLFETIAFKRPLPELNRYWNEMQDKHAAVIPLEQVEFDININD